MPATGAASAMSAPAFVPERGEVWYVDGNSGFYVLKLTNGVWPFGPAAAAAVTRPAPTRPPAGSGNAVLAVTGRAAPLGVIGVALGGALVTLRLRRRRWPTARPDTA
jgi:hypothetical protein